MERIITALGKLMVVSLAAGFILSRFGLSSEEILSELGMRHEPIRFWLEEGARWVIPNLLLGSLVIVPLWLLVWLFRPPRG